MSSPTSSAQGNINAAESAPQDSGDTRRWITGEWLPIAARLDALDDNGNARPAVARRPLLPFAELPPHQAWIRNYDARVTPGEVRYGVPPRVKLLDNATRRKAAVEIHAQVCEAHPGLEVGSVILKKRNRRTTVDISWPSSQPFNSATPLKLNGESLVFIADASRAKPTWITIVVRDVIGPHPDFVCQGLKSFLYPHQILDYWRGVLNYTDSDGASGSVGIGELYMLVELDMSEGLRRGLRHPNDVASSLPGFFAIGGRKHKLHYAARRDHCTFCKSTRFFEHHFSADCTSRR